MLRIVLFTVDTFPELFGRLLGRSEHRDGSRNFNELCKFPSNSY
jgi:hypothetical protein